MDLHGKIAIVTGGAGGLGIAVVRALLEAGAMVDVPVRNADDVAALHARLGHHATPHLATAPLDLTDAGAVSAAYTRVAEAHGGIDILVNIAGGFGGGTPVHQSDWGLWQAQIDVNLKTAVLSCAAAVPHMLARGGGAIVNVSTRTATQPGANYAAYAAAKRAVIQLTEALAAELRDQRITANVILPGTIDTPANRASMPGADHSRWVKPEEIAAVVRFLVGPEARIISGAQVPVYGRS